MAPVTRGRSGTLEKTKEGKVASPAKKRTDTSETSLERPIKMRGKRKSTSHDEQEKDTDDATQSTWLKTPKRQKIAVRTREEKTAGGGRKKEIEVQIPSSSTKRVRSSPVADSEDEEEESGYEIEIEPTSASKQLEEEASQQLASQARDPDPTPRPKPKSKHVVFGDDDDVEKFVAAGAETEKDLKEAHEEAGCDDDDDDDEAPEAVSTQAVAKERLKSAQAATEAAAKHAASLKRKRQERDNLFKQQAEKRKRTRTEERGQSKSPEADSDNHEGAVEAGKPATGRRRAEKHKLPDMLPAEFLADSSSEGEDEAALKRVARKLKKKIDFGDAAAGTPGTARPPRDEIVGTTRYRVLADQGARQLAPKANKNSRAVKEDMLKRKRAGLAPNKKKGFFVKR